MKLTIPADHARCLDGQCPSRETCLRWRARLDDSPRMVFGDFERGPGEAKCEMYWPTKETQDALG